MTFCFDWLDPDWLKAKYLQGKDGREGDWLSQPIAPQPPTIGTATAGSEQATITFSAPADNGGSVITSYKVTSSPGGFIGTGESSPITVMGLTDGTAYTFTVVAINAYGISAPSAASNSVTPVSGLLDDYSGAVALYGMSLLYTSYTGACLRVRRSSDNSEQDIGFVGIDFDTSAFTTFVGAGTGFCTKLYDQSGNNNDLVQATALNQPEVASTGIIQFDGSNDFLQVTFTLNQPMTQIGRVAWVTGHAAAADNPWMWSNAVGPPTGFCMLSGPDVLGYGGSEFGNQASPADDTYFTASVVYNGASPASFVQVDANAAVTGSSGANNPGGITLASYTTGSTQNSKCNFKAFVVFDSAKSSSTCTEIHNLLATI